MTNIVDLEKLREAIGDDPELERELFDEFIASSGELMAEMATHCETGSENETWRRASHALKGISANLGAAALAELCRQGQEAFERPAREKTVIYDRIAAERAKVVAYLQEQKAA